MTLVKSVLQAIPTYSMHIFRFPVSVCKSLDQMCRNFLWGDFTQRTRIRLIKWELITKPKFEGGLGLHRVKEFNIALFGKIAWGLLKKPNELWARVLINKYRGRWRESGILVAKQGDSWLWNAIVGSWNEIRGWVGWGIGNGCSVKFWSDRWINVKSITEVMGNIDVQDSEKGRPVRDYISESGEWNWKAFAGKVSHSVVLAIASIKPPDESINLTDFPVWIGSKNGKYSVSATYRNLTSPFSSPTENCLWKYIWNWEAPLE